ncbi:hypothetical protein [Dichotomicrobium thermohalophilum]|uniref:Uncharacterized protein n=1 Tax=Dichotomicrobium thermohalophilum TaxID=933063 RepID=A0A397Q6M8_9HYPH|nr:hypothetical protein [Dichotomicrobium thermohalophilum]RIA56742.1 hypothetical protein BXY53_1851 [Dichotomicrobium thermohalophilum]
MANAIKHDSSKLTLRRQEARESRLLYWLCFAVFLVIVVFARLLPGRHRESGNGLAGVRRSVFAEARASAGTLIPFAFMK